MSYVIRALTYDLKTMSYDIEALTYDIDLMTYDIEAWTYDIDLMSYDIKALTYDIDIMSYDIRALTYDIDAMSYAKDIASSAQPPASEPTTPLLRAPVTCIPVWEHFESVLLISKATPDPSSEAGTTVAARAGSSAAGQELRNDM